MNKETYIDALERKLWDRLDPDQLRDIISYYKDYFAMEAAKGISEEETIRKLGDPALLAKSILAAEGSKGESAESEIEQGIQKQGREFRGGKLLVLLVIVAVLIVLCAIIGLIFSVVSALLPFLFVLAFVFLSVLLSGICIQKRILPGSKKVLWCWTLLPYIGIAALAGSLFLRPQTYLYDRLLTALGLQHTDDGPGFTRLALQYEQTRFSLFGGSSVSDRLPREELYSTYLLHSIFLWFGIAAGILIIAALAFFALYSMHCALRQSNRLAMLLGTAASGVLLLELFNYVLTNFGINLFYTASVPFLSYGLTGTVANSILVGILLGIIRNRNVLYEKESGPAVIPDTGTV